MLNPNLLENRRYRADGAIIARCPACAAGGGDRKGEHLIIYPSGKYGCVAAAGDPGHRGEIYRLVGSRTSTQAPEHRAPRTVTIRPVRQYPAVHRTDHL